MRAVAGTLSRRCGDGEGAGPFRATTGARALVPSLFVLQPDVAATSASGLAFQLHISIGMALFTIWPFTRLVHAVTAPLPPLPALHRLPIGPVAAGPALLGAETVM